MRTVTTQCEECEKAIEKSAGEYNRSTKLGRKFFCNLSCAATNGNRTRKASLVVVECPSCGNPVETTIRRRAKRHCNRSCASVASLTAGRKKGARRSGLKTKNLISPRETLLLRESWKYRLLRRKLREKKEEHIFEHQIEGYIYDLFLPDKNTLIEFDGDDHRSSKKTIKTDQAKEDLAERQGLRVIRREVSPNTVISARTLQGVI